MSQASSDPTIAMIGGGYYSANALGAKQAIDATVPLVDQALRAVVSVPSEKPFAIADFGASDGGTSFDLMRHIVQTVRAALPQRWITLTYTDLPYTTISQCSSGGCTAIWKQTILNRLAKSRDYSHLPVEQVYIARLFPDETLSFGFSASAMHYLSVKPGPIADHVHAVGATETERALYRDQARSDWTAMLVARARELVPGGRLVLVNFCEDERGHRIGSTGGVDMYDALVKHWRGLADAGIISMIEYCAPTFQTYYKTVADFVAPFESDSPVTRAGLRLDHVSTMLTPCPFAAMFRQSGDAAAYAR